MVWLELGRREEEGGGGGGGGKGARSKLYISHYCL